MSQNPYAATGRVGGDDFSGIPTPSRMSVMAVIALVCGILGCIPGLSLLAILLGVAAIFLIAASKGRVRGTGLAIGGVVLGLIFTGIYVLFAIGTVTATQEFKQKVIIPAQAGLQGLEKGDKSALRALLTPTASANVTDAQIDQFASDVKAEFGAYKSSPDSLWNLIKAVRDMGQAAGGAGAGGGAPTAPGPNTTFNNAIPWPVEFEKGPAFLVLEMDVTGKQPATPGMMLPIVNIGVVRAPDMTKDIWLLPRTSGVTTPPAAPTPPVVAPAPETPPATEAPKPPDGGEGGGGG